MNVLWLALSGYIETLMVNITGCIVLGIRWTSYFPRLLIISGYVCILPLMLKPELNQVSFILVIMLTSIILINLLTDISFPISVFTVTIGTLFLLITDIIMMSFYDFFSMEVFYPLNWLASFIVLVFLKYSKLQIPLPKKTKEHTFCKSFLDFRWSFCLLFTLLICFILLYSVNLSLEENRLYFAISFAAFVLLSIFIVNKLYDGRYRDLKDSMDQQYDTELNQYIELITNQRSLNVDHLLKIRMMLEIGQFQTTKDYVDRLIDEKTLISEVAQIKSFTIAGILLAYKDYAYQKDIPLYLDIQDDLTNIPFSKYETNYLFKALIQNAVNISEKMPLNKREIHLRITKEEGQIQIEMQQLADSKILKDDSTENKRRNNIKPPPLLNSVNSIVRKHRGEAVSVLAKNLMCIKIFIPIKNKGGLNGE